jgi:hypothetical protein
MRVIGRLILWSFLLVVAWWAIKNSLSYFNWNQGQQVAWEKDYNGYTAYWLNPSKDLSFDIPANAAQIRIIVVAKQIEQHSANTSTVQERANSDQDIAHNIPLTFEFVSRDKADSFVISHQFNRNDMQQNEVPINPIALESGSQAAKEEGPTDDENQYKSIQPELPLRFFDKPTGAKASFGQVAYIDNKQYANLSIRAENISSQQVSVRVAVLEKKVASDLAIAWQRMHQKRREELLEEHIFPVDLVTEYEKKEALRYRWLPIGPNGTEAEDYTPTRLYVHANLVPAPTQQQLETKVLQNWSNQNERFTFEHTKQNPYQLTCDNQPQPKWLSLRYQSSDLQTNKHWFFQGKQLNEKIAIPHLDGRFEVQTENFCSIILTDNEGKVVEDNSNLLRAYRVDTNQAVTYQLTETHSKNQPLRVDFRALVEPNEVSLLNEKSLDTKLEKSKSSYHVDWQLVDATEQVLLSGAEELSLYNNRYETLDPARADYLKAKSSIYLQAPPTADRLIVRSEQVILVNAFSRPVDLAFAINQDNKPHLDIPKWFSIKPKDAEQLVINKRSELIDFRKRLVPKQTLQGLQQLMPLQPYDSHLAFELFEIAESEQQQYWHYHRIGTDHHAKKQSKHQSKTIEQSLNFYHERYANSVKQINGPAIRNADQEHVSASIVYRAEANTLKPFKVQVFLDDAPITDFWVSQNSGKIKLPLIKVGEHKLKLVGASKDVEWYINKSRPVLQKDTQPSALFRLRKVYPIKNKTTFVFNKQTDSEWLTFLFYPKINDRAQSLPAHFQALVSIESPDMYRISDSHTVASRKYFVGNTKPSIDKETGARNLNSIAAVTLLNQKHSLLGSSLAFKFPVEKDLKNREYRVTVELQGLDGMNQHSVNQNSTVHGYIQGYYVKDDVQQKIIYFNESIYD